VNIYCGAHKYEHVEDIFKLLCKKYNNSLKVWSGYLEFLFQIKDLKQQQNKFLLENLTFTDPKVIL